MSFIFNSSFLRGLGIGLIISGLVFALVNQNGLKSDAQATADQAASKSARTSPQAPKTNQTNTQTQTEQPTQEPNQQPAQQPAQNQNPTQGPTKNQGQTQTPNEPASSTSKTPQPTAPAPAATTFIVPRGSDSTRIANLLVQAGLVKDQIKFMDVADNMKAARRFKAGTFNIPAGASEVDIILILTK